jgi:hypothetical protein
MFKFPSYFSQSCSHVIYYFICVPNGHKVRRMEKFTMMSNGWENENFAWWSLEDADNVRVSKVAECFGGFFQEIGNRTQHHRNLERTLLYMTLELTWQEALMYTRVGITLLRGGWAQPYDICMFVALDFMALFVHSIRKFTYLFILK